MPAKPDVMVVENEHGLIRFGDCCIVAPRGPVFTPIGEPSFQELQVMSELLFVMEQRLPLLIGAFARYVRARHGEDKASQVLDASEGWGDPSRRVIDWTLERVSLELQNMVPPLYFGHLQVVAALPPEKQREWLDKAVEGEDGTPWSVAKLKMELKAHSVGGKSKLRYLLIVECQDEEQQQKLKTELVGRGLVVADRTGVIKGKKKPKKDAVTARRRRAPKMSTRRRRA